MNPESDALAANPGELYLLGMVALAAEGQLPRAPCPPAGLGLVTLDGTCALVGASKPAPEGLLVRHVRALEWAFGAFREVLPVRPSAPFPDRAAVLSVLRENHAAIAAELARLSGLVQCNVSIAETSGGTGRSRPATGTSYLMQFLPGQGAVATAGPIASLLDRQFAALAVDRRVESRAGRLRLAYLVSSERCSELVRTFRAVTGGDPQGSDLRFSGPCVPCSFARLLLRRPADERDASSLLLGDRDRGVARPAAAAAPGGSRGSGPDDTCGNRSDLRR